MVLYCLGSNSTAGTDCSHFSMFLHFKFQNCRQITATTGRIPNHCQITFHAAKYFQMPYTANINKINSFNNKIKKSLELRLGLLAAFGAVMFCTCESGSPPARLPPALQALSRLHAPPHPHACLHTRSSCIRA